MPTCGWFQVRERQKPAHTSKNVLPPNVSLGDRNMCQIFPKISPHTPDFLPAFPRVWQSDYWNIADAPEPRSAWVHAAL